MSELCCQLLHANAQVPTRAHASDAGFDLYAYLPSTATAAAAAELSTADPTWLRTPVVIAPGARVLVHTGVAVSCPAHTCYQIWPRSGWALKMGLDTLGGLIDSGYRGEVQVLLQNHGAFDVLIYHGDRIAQLVPVALHPSPQWQLTVKARLDDSDRDTRGFGSTDDLPPPLVFARQTSSVDAEETC